MKAEPHWHMCGADNLERSVGDSVPCSARGLREGMVSTKLTVFFELQVMPVCVAR